MPQRGIFPDDVIVERKLSVATTVEGLRRRRHSYPSQATMSDIQIYLLEYDSDKQEALRIAQKTATRRRRCHVHCLTPPY